MDMATTTDRKDDAMTTSNSAPTMTITEWQGEGFNRFCSVQHGDNSYTLRAKHSSISVYIHINGVDCFVDERDTLNGAMMLISEHARNTKANSNVCAHIHEPEFATIAMTVAQMEMLRQACIVMEMRRTSTAAERYFFAALHDEINAEIKTHEETA
jgi:hypothetical protein